MTAVVRRTCPTRYTRMCSFEIRFGANFFEILTMTWPILQNFEQIYICTISCKCNHFLSVEFANYLRVVTLIIGL